MEAPNPLTVQVDLGGTWHITLFFGLALGAVSWLYKSRAPTSVKVLWSYVLLSALFILEFPLLQFGEIHTAFVASAGQTLAEVVFIPLCALALTREIEITLSFFAWISLLCVWLNLPGLLHAPSFNLGFAALAIQFCPIWLRVFTLFTLLTHHGTTAILILMVQVIVTLLRQKRVALRAIYPVALIGLLPALALSAYFHSGPWFDGSERLQRYGEYFHFWLKEWRFIVLGVGPGTFLWTAALIDEWRKPLFLQMHSDWLQVLWENGVIGFSLAIWVFLDAVKRAWGDTRILSALFGCAVFALTYHPLRFFPTALLTAFIFVRAFNCKSDSSEARP